MILKQQRNTIRSTHTSLNFQFYPERQVQNCYSWIWLPVKLYLVIHFIYYLAKH